MSLGLGKKQLETIVEDALRHKETPSHKDIIDALITAIVENNKRVESEVANVVAKKIMKSGRGY